MKWKSLLALSFIVLAIESCNSEYTYKRKGYFAVPLPAKKYLLFDQPGYPYRFEYPVYGHVQKDSSFFGDAPENPWWLNIDFPSLHGKIYVSYKNVNRNNFDSLVRDGFRLAYSRHTEMATGIEDSVMRTEKGIEGIYFSLRGNTATANQFFLTDSVKHYLRGALYFDSSPNEDSLSTVNAFLRQDLLHLINTFEWKE